MTTEFGQLVDLLREAMYALMTFPPTPGSALLVERIRAVLGT